MNRLVLPAVVAVVAATMPLVARATADATYYGGCGVAATHRDLEPLAGYDTHVETGVLFSRTLVYSTTSSHPVSATVTCTLRVNGVIPAGGAAAFDGTAVVAGAKRVSYRASAVDIVVACTTVDYASDDTPTTTYCPDVTAILLFGPEYDLYGYAKDGALPVVCPLVGSLAPGVPGVVDVDAYGAVSVHGTAVLDCPPDSPGPEPAFPAPPECSDGIDNDLDGYVDYPADPDCFGPDSDAEGLQVNRA